MVAPSKRSYPMPALAMTRWLFESFVVITVEKPRRTVKKIRYSSMGSTQEILRLSTFIVAENQSVAELQWLGNAI